MAPGTRVITALQCSCLFFLIQNDFKYLNSSCIIFQSQNSRSRLLWVFGVVFEETRLLSSNRTNIVALIFRLMGGL